MTALVGLVCLGIAIADDPAPTIAPADAGPIANAVAAGKHVRIDGPRGPIHVWIPPSYHADTGATIIYVHGYFDDADTAWTGHQLPEPRFRRIGQRIRNRPVNDSRKGCATSDPHGCQQQGEPMPEAQGALGCRGGIRIETKRGAPHLLQSRMTFPQSPDCMAAKPFSNSV